MAMEWKRGKNPYVDNFYTRLQLRPSASNPEIEQRRQQLLVKIKAGRPVTVGARRLDEHAVNEAAKKLLREPSVHLEEALCVHRPLQSGKSRLAKLLKELETATSLAPDAAPVRFAHPLALLWFCPAPGPEYVAWPDERAFGLVAADDPADLDLDIVFDS